MDVCVFRRFGLDGQRLENASVDEERFENENLLM